SGLLDDVEHAHREVGRGPGLDGQADVRGGAGVQHRSPHRDLSKLIHSVDSIRPARASSTPGSSNVTAPPTAVASLGLLRTSRRPQAAQPAPRPWSLPALARAAAVDAGTSTTPDRQRPAASASPVPVPRMLRQLTASDRRSLSGLGSASGPVYPSDSYPGLG